MFSVLLGCSANLNEQIVDTGGQITDSEFEAVKTGSYVVFGKRYYPLESAINFRQRGIASWYGKKFHGRTTAYGEIYDMYEMTAAHKRLPLPTDVQVRNLENNRTIVVRVNDRGPFHGDRIIDLSFAAAEKLGMIEKGTAKVEIKTLSRSGEDVAQKNRNNTSAEDSATVHLQIGAFADAENADSFLRHVLKITGKEGRVTVSTNGLSLLHRVQIGPLRTALEAERLAGRLKAAGIDEYYLVRD